MRFGGSFWDPTPLDIFIIINHTTFHILQRYQRNGIFEIDLFLYPNQNVEERGFSLIHNNKGVMTAEKISPYVLDEVPSTPFLKDDNIRIRTTTTLTVIGYNNENVILLLYLY